MSIVDERLAWRVSYEEGDRPDVFWLNEYEGFRLSEQTRERLIYQAKNNLTPAARKELGRKLGESGAGNRKRWRRDEGI